jgi:hypothetical protein
MENLSNKVNINIQMKIYNILHRQIDKKVGMKVRLLIDRQLTDCVDSKLDWQLSQGVNRLLEFHVNNLK